MGCGQLVPLLGQLDSLLGSLREVVEGVDRQAAVGDDLLAHFDVGALEPDDQGLGEADVLARSHHALSHDVAAHDAAEDVDEDGLHVGVALDDLEGGRARLLVGRAADIQEVGRGAAQERQQIHGGHSQASTVDHARDAAVQLDVIQVKLLGLDLLRVLLGQVTLLVDGLLAERGVVVEADLGVAHDDTTIGELGERIDLDHGAVTLSEDLVETLDADRRGVGLGALEAHLAGHLLGHAGRDALHDVHRHLHDRARIRRGDILNGGATRLGANHQGATAAAIHEDCEVLLVLDLELLGQHDGVTRLARRAGLLRDQCLAEHLVRILGDLALVDDVHAALEVVLLEVAEAAATSQHLRLDHDLATIEALCLLLSLRRGLGHRDLRGLNPELLEDAQRLILVKAQVAARLHHAARSRGHHTPTEHLPKRRRASKAQRGQGVAHASAQRT
mmetsp:Transcript_34002/g.87180  ORF Transcript_34002/g.87180 Transcript_34002/m.87180 type:complete len:447 (-) Transcript_34002:25-1365(-)